MTQLLDKVENLVKEKLMENHYNRYLHITGVVEMAEYLAKEYNVDVEKAKIAAWMHDYSKYDDPITAIDLLSEDDINECEKYPFLYHAYLSAANYKKLVGNDEEIYQAIRNHVFGRPKMSMLEAIIMIADFTEKHREYPMCIECRKILLSGNFDLAIVNSLESTMKKCKENNEVLHPYQIEVYNEYLRKVNKLSLEEVIIQALDKVKAEDVIVYDTKEKSPFYDNIILASVNSERQAASVISYIKDDVSINGYEVRNVEGVNTPWVLIDCNSIVVSVFTKQEREHFGLEKIYLDIPHKKIS